MPIEKTLPDPLSGQEIKEIAIQEFRNRLNANSILADDLTYSGFGLKMEAVFSLPGRETLVWSDVMRGDKPAEPESVKDEFVYRTESPNEARQSHDLPIPVEVRTPSGVERRKVKFAPK